MRLDNHVRQLILIAKGNHLCSPCLVDVCKVLNAKAENDWQYCGLGLRKKVGLMFKSRLMGVVLSEIDDSNAAGTRHIPLHTEPIVVQPLSIVMMSNELGPILFQFVDKRGNWDAHLGVWLLGSGSPVVCGGSAVACSARCTEHTEH